MEQIVMTFTTGSDADDVLVTLRNDGGVTNSKIYPLRQRLLALLDRSGQQPPFSKAAEVELTFGLSSEDGDGVLVTRLAHDRTTGTLRLQLKANVIALLLEADIDRLFSEGDADPATVALRKELGELVTKAWLDGLAKKDPAAAAAFLADPRKYIAEHLLRP